MKNRKVSNVRMHVGVTFPGHTGTSLDKKVHGADMDLTAAGVVAKLTSPSNLVKEYFIPFTNILYLEMCPETK